MRLTLSVEALGPNLSGIGRYNWELATRLAHHGEIARLSLYRGNRLVPDPQPLLAEGYHFPRTRVPRWLHARQMARHHRGKLFHGPNFFLPEQAENGIVTVHDLSVFRYPETHPADRLAQFEREFARSVRQCDHILTDSEAVRQELIAFAGLSADRVTAIHLGVAKTFAPAAADTLIPALDHFGLRPGEYVLCVSTLEPRKKIAELLAAWSMLPSAISRRWPLVLAGGSGWLNETLAPLLAQAEAHGTVRYLGYVPETALPALYAGARLFLYPSMYEGFGLPPIEAMASGVPVIISDTECLREVTCDAALAGNPNDTEGFAALIERGIVDDSWRNEAVAAGLAVATRYTWERCIDRTVGIYRHVWNEAGLA